MTPAQGDTIVARATARGIAAIAMIRLSGPSAVDIAAGCFSGSNLQEKPSHSAHVGFFHNTGGADIDQVVVTLFRAPSSVTGEDVVEITCHGGEVVVHRVVQALINAGARPAEPGEFTQRAFLNGKMDLAQAESVGELIHSSSRRAQATSFSNMKGSYSLLLRDLREEMLDLCGFIELELDFTDEDVEFADKAKLERLLVRAEEILSQLVGSYRYGSILREGIRVVLAGRPNAGKSTLLNALVGFDRAIVSDTPGTTRDQIGEEREYDGLLFRFTDTAGIRDSSDEIEAEGVRRAEQSVREADVLIYVYDATVGLGSEEQSFLDSVAAMDPSPTLLIIRNKVDLLDGVEQTGDGFSLSALEAMNDESIIHPLLETIIKEKEGESDFVEASYVVTNERHMHHLQQARTAVVEARIGLAENRSGDLISIDLRAAMTEIGAITGATATEDVLDRIFSRFCIGK